jgi:hypothetical protein
MTVQEEIGSAFSPTPVTPQEEEELEMELRELMNDKESIEIPEAHNPEVAKPSELVTAPPDPQPDTPTTNPTRFLESTNRRDIAQPVGDTIPQAGGETKERAGAVLTC